MIKFPEGVQKVSSSILKILCLFGIIYLTQLSVIARNGDYVFKHLTLEDGLSYSNVEYIYQDYKGYMWFGTADGLNKYDGYNFEIFRFNADDSLTIGGNFITGIVEDNNNNLWVSTVGGGLNRYDRANNTFIRYQLHTRQAWRNLHKDIHALLKDYEGNLWIGSRDGLVLFNPYNYEIKDFVNDSLTYNSLTAGPVWALCEDADHNIWVSVLSEGIDVLNRKEKTFKNYRFNRDDANSLSHNEIMRIYKDSEDEIWLGTFGNGFNRYNKEEDNFIRYTVENTAPNGLNCHVVFSFLEDRKGNFWIGTETGGLNLFDRKKNTFQHYSADRFNARSLSHNSVECLYEDDIGTLWVGTFNGGVDYSNKYSNKFPSYSERIDKFGLSSRVVLAFCEDINGDIWVGTDGGGLNLLKKDGGYFEYYMHDKSDINSISNDVVLSLYIDKQEQLWIGTYSGGLNKYNRKTGTFTRYMHNPDDPASISRNDVRVMMEDRNGNFWIGTAQGGLNKLDRRKGTFEQFFYDKDDATGFNSLSIYAMHEDKQGYIWMGTYGDGLCKFNPKTGELKRYVHDINNDKSIINNQVFSLFEDSRGNFWVGTTNGLEKFDKEKETFEHYNTADGLPNDVINGILEDNAGNLWISTNKGLSMFNTVIGEFQNYTPKDGLQGNQFKHTARYKTKDGALLFGGVNGFNFFYPYMIKDNPYPPNVEIVDIKLFNKEIPIGGDEAILQKHISETNSITLTHDQTVITFEFAGLDYVSPDENEYAYMLEGLEKDWNYVGNRRFATYTSLPHGKYTLKVKAANNDGMWNKQEKSLRITVLPPYWKTWWFRLTFIVVLGFLVFTIFYLRIARIKKANIRLENMVDLRTKQLRTQNFVLQQQKEELNTSNTLLEEQKNQIEEQAEELSEQKEELQLTNERLNELVIMKDNFISIIGHDLKNPFSSLMGYSDMLVRSFDKLPKEKIYKISHTISHSSKNIYNLLDNILHWAKAQSKVVKPVFEEVEVSGVVDSVSKLLKERLEEKNITLLNNVDEDIIILSDKLILDTILRNIIHNAVKFTSDGNITVSTVVSPQKTEIEITDTGVGMTQKQVEHLFVFSKSKISPGTKGETGTGLGMFLCYELVRYLRGDIDVESVVNQGTKVKISLPKLSQNDIKASE